LPNDIRALRPSTAGPGNLFRGLASQVLAIVLVVGPRAAQADREYSHSKADSPLPSTANLDGFYLGLGPVLAAAYQGQTWDGAFGGELVAARVHEAAPVAAIGLAFGAVRLTGSPVGRLWADVLVASKRPLGIALGLSGGISLRVGEVEPTRAGWQATVWAFAGVVPYVRAGKTGEDGGFFDAGVKIVLPAVRWR
jgi:hypothetical protein